MAEEWDSSAAQPSTGGFAGRGFGRGILGKTALPTDLTNGVGSTETKKFGSRGRGGLANKENVNGSDDVKPGFGNAPSFGGGFGSKRGGFGGGQSVPSNSSDSQPSRSGFGGGRGGFGGGRGGFGGGRGGFGNSSVKNDWDNSENSDSKPGRGFGGARGGFGGGRGSFGGSSRYNDESSQSNQNRGFGTSRGGFGRGGARGFGFRNDSGDDAPRGGGFSQKYGGGEGGNKSCFKCGEDGHMSRECPRAESSDGRSRGCFKCGEDGHMSRDCPNGGGRGKCFKCGEDGHMARDCTSTDSSRSHGGGDGKCFKCNESGHMARACTNAESFSGGADRPVPYIPPAPTDDESEIFKSIEKGINFDKYDTISVEVSGRDPVNFISSFDEAGLYPSFLRNVKRAGYEKPTPVQKYAIPIIAAGRDLMACAQTGSGKTAAFLLPVLTAMMNQGLQTSQFSIVQYPQAVIVAPTRELACQIYMDARKFSHSTDVRPVVVYGGTSVGYQIREVEKGAHLVVGTPGRLLDMINKQKISLEKVSFLVLDEADRMLDMGFEPEIRKMVETMGMPHKTARQTLMFSATFPEEIQKLAADFLNDYLFVTVGRVGGANTDVEQNVFEVDRLRKRDKLCEILTETGSDKTLVFVEQKRNADFLASYLSQSGFPTTSIHGDRQQREREEALRDFKKGTAPILIATSVAARGLDIPNVKHVINYDLPSSIDEYVHRIGRTGRCGNLGKATSFYSNEQDSTIVKSLVRILTEANQIVPEWLETYALTSTASIDTSSSLFSGKYGGKDIRHGKFNSGGKGGNAWEDKWGGGDAAIDTGGDAEEWD